MTFFLKIMHLPKCQFRRLSSFVESMLPGSLRQLDKMKMMSRNTKDEVTTIIVKGQDVHLLGDGLLLSNIKSFLYDTLVRESNWNFGSSTPSQLEIEYDSIRKRHLLNDQFMACSTWLLMFKKSYRFVQESIHPLQVNQDGALALSMEGVSILGVMRVIEDVPIEVAGYADIKNTKQIADLIETHGAWGLVECNRLALKLSIRQSHYGIYFIMQMILYLGLKHRDDRPLVFTTPTGPYKNLTHKLNRCFEPFGPERIDETFYYEPEDLFPVQMFIWNRPKLRKLAHLFENL